MKFSTYVLLGSALTVCQINNTHADSLFDANADYMLGDWQGKRTELAQQGLRFDANIQLDVAYLADGGAHARLDPTYTSQLWLGAHLDLEKILGWDGVSVRGLITARQGQSVSVEQISDPLAPQMAGVQSSFGRGNSGSRLSEFSIEKQFKQQGVSVRLGRFGMGTYFNVMACDFQNTSFCAAQMGKWQGSKWYNTPVSQWAGMVKYQVTPELYAQAAVFEFNPKNSEEDHGWNLSTSDADGVTIPVEMVWQPKAGLNDLPGSYRVGVMYNTADQLKNQKDIVTGAAKDHSYGAWFAAEQQLTQQGSGKQGLHGFINLTFHDDATNKIDNTQQAGLKYVGLFANRAQDTVGLGVNRIQVSDRFREQYQNINKSAEYNLELNYSYHPTKWAMLRPNIQYVIHPGATDRVDNAFVLGLTSRLVF